MLTPPQDTKSDPWEQPWRSWGGGDQQQAPQTAVFPLLQPPPVPPPPLPAKLGNPSSDLGLAWGNWKFSRTSYILMSSTVSKVYNFLWIHHSNKTSSSCQVELPPTWNNLSRKKSHPNSLRVCLCLCLKNLFEIWSFCAIRKKKLELTWSLQKNNKINHNQRTTPSSPFPWCAGSPQPPPPPRPLPPWRLPQRPRVRRTRPAAQSSEPVPRGAIGSLWDDGVSRMPINRGNYKQKPCVKHHLSWSQL